MLSGDNSYGAASLKTEPSSAVVEQQEHVEKVAEKQVLGHQNNDIDDLEKIVAEVAPARSAAPKRRAAAEGRLYLEYRLGSPRVTLLEKSVDVDPFAARAPEQQEKPR